MAEEQPRPHRRHLLTTGALSAATTACSSSSKGGPAVHSTKRVQWNCASSFPRSLDTIFGAAEVLSQRVEAMTDGNFTIRVYPSGQLVPAAEVMGAVQRGAAQMGQTGGYYYRGMNPALAFDTCVPFGMTARQQTAWLLEGGGLELMRGVYADFGIVSFPGGNTGAQMGGWFKEELPDLGALAGRVMRIPGLGGEVMSRLGVQVQNIPADEIYQALERGAIDATEWVGPYDDEVLGLHKAASYYYYPGWWEPGPSLSFLVNQKEWDELPSAYQAAFEAATHEAASAMQTRYDAKNPDAYRRMKEYGVDMRPFSEDLLIEARKAAEEILDDEAGKDAKYAEILAHWRDFRAKSFEWFGAAELEYARFAFGSG